MATKRLFFSCVVLIALTGSGTALWGQGAGFAYVANYGDDTVSIYAVDAATGQLRARGYVAAGKNPNSVTVDPSGKFVYVASYGARLTLSEVYVYAIDSNTGTLTAVTGSPFDAGAAPTGIAIDPSGKFAYVTNSVSTNILAYSINSSTGTKRKENRGVRKLLGTD